MIVTKRAKPRYALIPTQRAHEGTQRFNLKCLSTSQGLPSHPWQGAWMRCCTGQPLWSSRPVSGYPARKTEQVPDSSRFQLDQEPRIVHTTSRVHFLAGPGRLKAVGFAWNQPLAPRWPTAMDGTNVANYRAAPGELAPHHWSHRRFRIRSSRS